MTIRALICTFLAASIPGTVAAQSVFKCLDGRSITYSSTPCEKLGLTQGGEIRDRVTTVPAIKPAVTKNAALSPGAVAAKPENEADLTRRATVKPVSPLIEKLAK